MMLAAAIAVSLFIVIVACLVASVKDDAVICTICDREISAAYSFGRGYACAKCWHDYGLESAGGKEIYVRCIALVEFEEIPCSADAKL